MNNYKIQVILEAFNLQIDNSVNYKWTQEIQLSFDRLKKELKDGTLRLGIKFSELKKQKLKTTAGHSKCSRRAKTNNINTHPKTRYLNSRI